MASDPKLDARLRPFRGGAWAVYLVVAVGYSCLVIYSVTSSVFEMSPKRPRAVEQKNVAACVREVRQSYDELEQERRRLGAERATEADQRWLGFRQRWIQQIRHLEAECDLDSPERSRLRLAFAQLEQVMDLATVQATQVAGQVGPGLEKLRGMLAELEALER